MATAGFLDDDCIPNNVVRDLSGKPLKQPNGLYVTRGEEQLDPGPQIAKNQVLPIEFQVPKYILGNIQNPDPPKGILRLSSLQVKAIRTMLGNALSANSYEFIGPTNYLGKYQLSATVLEKQGYIKLEFLTEFLSNAVKKSAAWTGKNGLTSIETFFRSPSAQENIMFDLLKSNYETMVKNQAIKEDDNLCTIAGMLCVAHILGPDLGTELAPGAKLWRQTGSGKDDLGNYGTRFFLIGRYAIDVLASVKK